MKKNTLVILLLIVVKSGFSQDTLSNEARLQWWKDAKFGLFLHWGLYSVTAGDWNGHKAKGNEHFMLYERIPVAEYGKIAERFNPDKFNADQWVKYAKDAGMKYIVITSKHHDGFAMFNSPSSDYNIVKMTPSHLDPMKALASACKRRGIKLCFYYSLGRDWQDPDVPTNWPVKAGRSNTWDYPNEDAKNFSKYFHRKVLPQVRELLTQYGPVGIMWFDTPELISKEQSAELKQLIRTLQPQCIVNSRVGNGLGDYEVSEQKLTTEGAEPWEACITMNATWGYNHYDQAWKSPELLVRQLIEVVSKGGNLLLNVGPMGDGAIPARAVENLAGIGAWMKINNEAIYGVHPWAVNHEGGDIPVTVNQPKVEAKATMLDNANDATSKLILPDIYFTAKDNVVYVFARSWKDKEVAIRALASGNQKVKNIILLGSPDKLIWSQGATGLNITMPVHLPQSVPVYVFKVTCIN